MRIYGPRPPRSAQIIATTKTTLDDGRVAFTGRYRLTPANPDAKTGSREWITTVMYQDGEPVTLVSDRYQGATLNKASRDWREALATMQRVGTVTKDVELPDLLAPGAGSTPRPKPAPKRKTPAPAFEVISEYTLYL